MGLKNVEFRPGEIGHLPVADGSVNVILSNCVINLSPEKQKVLREAFRILRPRGAAGHIRCGGDSRYARSASRTGGHDHRVHHGCRTDKPPGGDPGRNRIRGHPYPIQIPQLQSGQQLVPWKRRGKLCGLSRHRGVQASVNDFNYAKESNNSSGRACLK